MKTSNEEVVVNGTERTKVCYFPSATANVLSSIVVGG